MQELRAQQIEEKKKVTKKTTEIFRTMADCNNLFKYSDERFADLQMLRYQLGGFEKLSLKTKKYIYCLSKATIYGRDITFDQNGKYNLLVRKTLEYIYENYSGNRNNEDFKAMTIYLKSMVLFRYISSLWL